MRGGGGQGRCERRNRLFVKKKFFLFGGGGLGGRVMSGPEGGSGWGLARVDVNKELKFL